MQVQFAEGDTLVHPRHGVGRVRRAFTRGKGSSATAYLELFFEPKALTITLPAGNLDEVGIRRLSTSAEADAIFAILAAPSDVPTTWSDRNAETVSRVRSSELAQASMVVRDLTRHAQRLSKPMSTAENATLESCLQTLSAELSLVLDLPEDETRDLILRTVSTETAEEA